MVLRGVRYFGGVWQIVFALLPGALQFNLRMMAGKVNYVFF